MSKHFTRVSQCTQQTAACGATIMADLHDAHKKINIRDILENTSDNEYVNNNTKYFGHQKFKMHEKKNTYQQKGMNIILEREPGSTKIKYGMSARIM